MESVMHLLSGISLLVFVVSIITIFTGDNIGTGILLFLSSTLGLYICVKFHEKQVTGSYWKSKVRKNNRTINHEVLEQERRDESEKIRIKKLEFEQKKKLVESTAMNEVVNFEKNNYRTPVDVSADNVGYDIKSSNSTETRFIEVKGKSEIGDIQITNNEWNKAKELENSYYLYVVYDCSSNNPSLYIIQNPANKLSAEFNSSKNKYIIKKDEIIKNKA